MVFLNFYALAEIIAVIFLLMTGIFLLTIKKKSNSTVHLGISFVIFSVFNLAYCYTSMFYHPIGAIHRWFTVLLILPTFIHIEQFLLSFPYNPIPKASKILFYSQYAISFGLTFVFVAVTLRSEYVFHFAGHYWDYKAEAMSRVVGAFIFLYYFIMIGLGIWKFIKIKSKERWAILWITAAVGITWVVPIIANILSRDGKLDRGVYQTLFVLLTLLGMFITVIIYVNHTKDKTTFMAKIVGVTLLSFLILFQWLSYIFLTDKEVSYDQLHKELTSQAFRGKIHPDVRYVVAHGFGWVDQEGSLGDMQPKEQKEASAQQPINVNNDNVNQQLNPGLNVGEDNKGFDSSDIIENNVSNNSHEINKSQNLAIRYRHGQDYLPHEYLQSEAFNTLAFHILEDLSAEKFQTQLKQLLSSAPEFFSGYKNVIQQKLSDLIGQDSLTKEEIKKQTMAFIVQLNAMNYVHENKIIHLPDNNFREHLIQYVQKQKQTLFIPFQDAILASLSQTNLEKDKLRYYVLNYIRPFKAADERRYREGVSVGSDGSRQVNHNVAYYHVDIPTQTVFEVGYSYIAYRQYMHPSSWKLTVILIIIVFVVLIIFPLFFRGSLITPLSNLLSGVQNINQGRLNVYIKPLVQDEIGYLTKSFNLMTRTIRESGRKLKDYAENLEQMVEQRTAELKKSFEEIQGLKLQQDGDYFLTSLLIKPLGINEAFSKSVNIDFLVKQKKQFRFRKWETEIGGDICIANTIQLRGRNYVVFVNGDAMGKSIQGAGGALVLGVVFRSVITRTKNVQAEQKKYPEQWLKECFIELQKVFESFDGSMLISVVMGLIDDETGLMYYLNAEHPWTVLYRDGKASFIEQELFLHKIGTTGVHGDLSLQTFQLRPKDVIIAGSDGRDDVILGMNEKGVRVINEDEMRFLRHVEEAKGHLEPIEANVRSSGELTDDLSLLRISFYEEANLEEINLHQNPSDEVLQIFRQGHDLLNSGGNMTEAIRKLEQAFVLDQNYPALCKDLARAYFKVKDYAKAAQAFDRYIDCRPDDVQFIYLCSLSFKKIKDYNKAADLGERVRLRQPKMINNLLNLGDIYRLKGNKARAQMLLDAALALEPSTPNAIKLQNALRQF